MYIYIIIEESLEVKLPTKWTDEKADVGRITEEKSVKEEDQRRERVRKVADHCVSRLFCGSTGSKSRLAKAAGAEPSGQMRNEQDAAHEPECSHAEHFCETSDLNSTCFPAIVPVHCRLWNAEEGGVQSVECRV